MYEVSLHRIIYGDVKKLKSTIKHEKNRDAHNLGT